MAAVTLALPRLTPPTSKLLACLLKVSSFTFPPRFHFFLLLPLPPLTAPVEDFAFQHHKLSGPSSSRKQRSYPSSTTRRLLSAALHNVWRSVSPATPPPRPPVEPSCIRVLGLVVQTVCASRAVRRCTSRAKLPALLQCAPRRGGGSFATTRGRRARLFLQFHLLSCLQRPPSEHQRWRSSESWLLVAAVPEEC